MRGPKPAITLYYGTTKLAHHRYPVPDGADAWLSNDSQTPALTVGNRESSDSGYLNL